MRVNRERWDTICERGILALTLAVLVFGPLAIGAVRAQDFAVIQFLTVGASVLWILRLWIGERPQFLWPPVCWAVLAFTAYTIGRYYTADIEYVARQELLRVLTYALIFFIVLNNLHRQSSVQIITLTLIFLGMAISVYAAYQFLSGSDRVWTFVSPYKGRAGGTYICPNHFAGFLEMLLPLALAYAATSRLKTVMKVLAGYAALVMTFGIAVSLSRGGWLATAAALALFVGLLFLRRSFGLRGLLVLIVLLGAGGILAVRSDYFQERFKKAFNEHSPTKVEDIRFELWRPAVRMWRDHVWFGVGPGHFNAVFGEYRPQVIQVLPDRVHNDYLNTLTDWGVTGFALVAGAWGLLAAGVVKTWRSVRGGAREFGSNQSSKFAVVLGATVGLAALLLHSLVDFNMHIPANAILAVTLMALLSSHLRFASDDYWCRARLWLKCVATLVLAASVVYLGAQGWQRFQETRWLSRAKKLPFASPKQAEALQKAFAIAAGNADTAYAIGECFRVQSWEGGSRYQEQAQQALTWFERGAKLNPHDAYLPLRHGMCLDWLDRQAEAAPFFKEAERLDPNNHFIVAHLGWHYEQTGDFAAARECFRRSLMLKFEDNPIAASHLEIAEQRLAQAAAK